MLKIRKSIICLFLILSLCLSACGSDSIDNVSTSNVETKLNDNETKNTTEKTDNSNQTSELITETESQSENSTSTDSIETESVSEEKTVDSETTENQESTAEQETTNKEDTTDKVISDKETTDKETTNKQTTVKETTKKETTANKATTTKAQQTTTANKQPSNQDELTTRVNKIISEIITPGMSDLEKAVVVHDYITYTIDYDYDDYLAGTIPNTSYNPLGALQTSWAVCDGYAQLFLALAKAAGLEVTYVSGVVDGGGKVEGHAWNQIKIDGKWYNVDVTWDDPTEIGKEHQDHKNNSYSYFLISDSALINANHKWDTSWTKTCSENINSKKLYNALKNVTNKQDIYFADNVSQIENAIIEMKKKGIKSFSIILPNDIDFHGTWDYIEMYAAKNKTQYVCEHSIKGEIYKHNVKVDETIRPILKFSEIKDVLKEYTGSYEDIRIRWYSEDITQYNITDYNLRNIISYELAEAGIKAKLCTYTEPRDNHTTFTLEASDVNAIVIDDFAELVELGDSINNKTVWYSNGAINSDSMHTTVDNVTIPLGKRVYFSTGSKDEYYGVTSFEVAYMEDSIYAKDLEAAKALGVETLVSKEIFIPLDFELYSAISNYIAEQLGEAYIPYGRHEESGFYVCSLMSND